jgi:pimeloyl-ACP methyl ester carboxylesterase
MLREVLDALHIDVIDLIGNDSGGGICQIFSALNPERVRTLTLTNCDTHDNWPPEAFKPFVKMAAAGGLKDTLNAMVQDKSIYRSPGALGPAYENPESVTDDDIDAYLKPFLRSEQRINDLQRFVGSFDNHHTLAIEPKLRLLEAPTLIVWGTDDIYFPTEWAHWLHGAIPGAKPPIILEGARLFLMEERADTFNAALRKHWSIT